MQSDRLLSLSELAKHTQLTTRTLRNHLNNGILHGVKVGGQWRFSEQDITDYLNNNTHLTANSPIDNFLNNKTCESASVLTVIDLPIDEERAMAKEFLLKDLLSRFPATYTYEYINNRARFTITATPELMISALDLLS